MSKMASSDDQRTSKLPVKNDGKVRHLIEKSNKAAQEIKIIKDYNTI
jgi:hypothetical protein